MIELGKTQELVIHRINEHGGFLGEPHDSKNVVLLPGRQLPQGAVCGDSIQVFV